MAGNHSWPPVAALLLTVAWLVGVPSALANGAPSAAENQEKAEREAESEPLDCRRMVRAAERRYRIPAQILSALTLAESGRWLADDRAFVAWPWTVYAQGKGRYFADRAAAVAAVRALQADGVRNIDVGCMQVNLHYHPAAFGDLRQALDPDSNIDYAARLLRGLYEKRRSWTQAIAHYHSATRALNRPYRKKVIRLWHKERRRAIDERRRLVQAAYAKRQAARRKNR